MGRAPFAERMGPQCGWGQDWPAGTCCGKRPEAKLHTAPAGERVQPSDPRAAHGNRRTAHTPEFFFLLECIF